MRDALNHCGTRRQKLACGLPVYLQQLTDRPGKYRDPDEDAYDIVAAPVFEAALHPVQEKHPQHSNGIDAKAEKQSFSARYLVVLAVQKGIDNYRNEPKREENVIKQLSQSCINNQVNKFTDQGIPSLM
jgi:hypothetical protein